MQWTNHPIQCSPQIATKMGKGEKNKVHPTELRQQGSRQQLSTSPGGGGEWGRGVVGGGGAAPWLRGGRARPVYHLGSLQPVEAKSGATPGPCAGGRGGVCQVHMCVRSCLCLSIQVCE